MLSFGVGWAGCRRPRYSWLGGVEHLVVWDAAVTYTHSSEKWWVRGFAKNFTDERYRTGSLSVGNFWIMSAYAPPEYYGMEVGLNLDF